MYRVLAWLFLVLLWSCGSTMLKETEQEYNYTQAQLKDRVQKTESQDFAEKLKINEAQWELAKNGAKNPVRQLRLNLWFDRMELAQNELEQELNLLQTQSEVQQKTMAELHKVLEKNQNYANNYRVAKAEVISKAQVEKNTVPLTWQWELIKSEWVDAEKFADSASQKIQTLESTTQKFLELRAQRDAQVKNILELQKYFNVQVRLSQQEAAQKIASLSDSLFTQKRVWQEKYEDLLQKSMDREFLKDQLSLTLQELRGVAHTAMEKIQSCNQNLQNLSEKSSQAYGAFMGIAALGLRGVSFEDGRFILSVDRTEMLDKSLELLQTFWSQAQIDAVHWVDTNEFAAESTLVANVVKKRHAYLQSRLLLNIPEDSLGQKLSLRGCVRHNHQLVVLEEMSADSNFLAEERKIRDYGDISLVVFGDSLPTELSMDSATACTEAEILLLERGALSEKLNDEDSLAHSDDSLSSG